eukprot:363145-Chlamydomonas_euryale.AAC.8
MKSRWLWNVTTRRPRNVGSWQKRDAKIRPTRRPRRVPKLLRMSSGLCSVARPCPYARAKYLCVRARGPCNVLQQSVRWPASCAKLKRTFTLMSFPSFRLDSRKRAVGPSGRCTTSIALISLRSSLNTTTSVYSRFAANFTIFFKG